MATTILVARAHDTISVSRSEATHIIALLTAQLAGVHLTGHHAGACPEIVVKQSDGTHARRLSFVLEND